MTTLIQQRSPNDCALASIAMAAGKEKWEDLWTDEDLASVLGKGVGDLTPWMVRAGFESGVQYVQLYTYEISSEFVKKVVWRRRALLSVASLNNAEGSHMIYWDGQTIFDPSTAKTFEFLNSVSIRSVVLFNDL